MRSVVDIIRRSMRVHAIRPGRGAAVAIDTIVTVADRDHVVSFARDEEGRKGGTWATAEPAQFVVSGYYRMVASVVHALGDVTAHDAARLREVLRTLHDDVCVVADAALDAYDATRGAQA